MIAVATSRSFIVAVALTGCTQAARQPPSAAEDSDPETTGGTPRLPDSAADDTRVVVDAAVSAEEADAPGPTPDAAPSPAADARGDVGSAADILISSPGCAGFKWCDDFESYVVGSQPKARWSVSTNGGTVAVDGTRAFSGKQSVKFATNDGAAGRHATIQKSGAPLFPLPNNEIWGRMMMWLDASPLTIIHWDNIRASGSLGQNGYAHYAYGGSTNKHLMGNYYQSIGGKQISDCWKTPGSVSIPEKRWACIEWHFSGPKNTMEYWIDGKKTNALTVVDKGDGCFGPNKWIAPTFNTMIVGWGQAQKSEIPIEMWLDDVVMDSKGQIGCPRQP